MIQIDLPMPKGCDECPLNYDFCWCRGVEVGDNRDNEWPNDFDFSKRADWCPLKEKQETKCLNCIYEVARVTDFGIAKCVDGQWHDSTWFCANWELRE